GRTRPTKPIAPAALTSTAVIRAVTTSSSSRVRPTAMPRVAAADDPKVKASSAECRHQHSTKPAAQTSAVTVTSVQLAPASEPSSQNRIPRVRSASAEDSTMNEVSAENNWVPATPASTTFAAPPPAPAANSSTRPNETKAPTSAPVDSDTRPPPTPSTATITAPVDAPEEIPRTNGSASGLRSSDCMIAPQTASPAPQ